MNRDYSYYPLTYPQQNIFKTEVAYPNTTIGIITATMRIIDDKLDLDLVEKAINLIIEHNDSMRARIKMINREPRQYFVDYEYQKLDIIDLTDRKIEELYEYDKYQTSIPFDLTDNQLYKFSLIKINENEFAVFLKIHHLISDGWSTVRVGNYILDYYEKLQNDIAINFDKIPSYNEYIVSESQYLSSDLFMKDKEFWQKKFENVPEPSMIKPRKSNLVNIKAKRRTFVLPDRLITQLRQYCKDTRTSIFAVILSAFAIYLNRITHKDSVSIGTLVLNRSSRRQKNTVGMFISTVPISVSLDSNMNFIEFNKALTREWMSVLKHQRYPFEYLLKDIRKKHKGVKDLFDIVFSYQNASFTENDSSKEHTSRWHFNALQKESLTIHIHDRDDMGKLLLDYDYLVDLFYEKEIEFLHDNFTRILWHALDNPKKSMSNLELISEAEKRRILHDFNAKKVDYPKDKSIVDFISEQVDRNPEKVALIHGDNHITYKELDEKSNSLANILVNQGVKADDIVCVLIDKSIEMIIALLSILKAGGAYLAIENDLPDERKKFLFKDSTSEILLTNRYHSSSLGFDGKVIYLEDDWIYEENTSSPNVNIKASDLAYVLYTSGTTGEPKGVMIEHKSVVNYVHGFLDEFKYTGDEVLLEQASYSFDAFVEEVYPTLFTGGVLVIADKYGAKDMKKISEVIIKNNITVVSVSPLVLNELNKMDCFDSIKLYISGGDVLKYEYMNNLLNKSTVYNTYGPTETTVCATYHKCDDIMKDNIPIGKPVANYSLFILDRNLNLLPIGVPGDLYISGPGLARGYLNRPELTKKTFIDNPFLSGEKMYKTNDIARWYPMGEVGYIGRADRQVKIRGIRIELGEIENRLLKHDKIKSVVVLDRKNSDEKKLLCVYYVAKEHISIQEIRQYLRHELPSYMIPSYFLEMQNIPLSASGKVNIKALPDIKSMVLNEQNEYVAPSNDIEKRLVCIVQKLLKIDKAGMNDNYFDLGGDSLSITTLTYDIIDEFDVDIPLEKLFKANSLKEISEIIESSSKIQVESKDKNLILMHKGSNENKNIFFIHDGIGGIGVYLDLCNNLDEYNIWGIRSDNQGIAPKNLTIEEIANSYVKQIINVADEPYSIAGWCIGGTIAFEVLRQLENLNLKVNTLFLIDSIPPMVWKNEKRFSIEGENLFINENIKYNNIVKSSQNTKEISDLWQAVIDNIDHSIFKVDIIDKFMARIPTDIKQYFDDYHTSSIKDIFSLVNQVRTYHVARAFYFPIEKIKADICYFAARENSVVKDSKLWGNYTLGNVDYRIVDGNHDTMLNLTGAKYISDIIKEYVK